MTNIPFILTKNAITIALDGVTYTIPNNAPNYNDVKSALIRNETDISVFKKLLNIKSYIPQITEGRAEIVDGKLYFDGEPLNGALAERVAAMLAEGFGVLPLLKFLNRVASNPRMDKNNKLYSENFQNELYLFLESGDCPITENGTFLAYKIVNSDFKDIYTGTIDNSPGKVVSLERPEDVDPDRNNTCSYGLHFASLNYILNGNYANLSNGNRLLVVEVDPADVISIPYDYNNSKGRTWRYTVVREIDSYDKIKPYFVSNKSSKTVDYLYDYEKDIDYEDDFTDYFKSEYDDEENDYQYSFQNENKVNNECDQLENNYFNNKNTRKIGKNILDDNQVIEIRALLNKGESLAAIARLYGVSSRTIARIRDGETYTNVK
jgi:hypothetical protein